MPYKTPKKPPGPALLSNAKKNAAAKKAVAKKAEAQRRGMAATRAKQQKGRPTAAQLRILENDRKDREMAANMRKWERANRKGLN